MPKGPLAVNLTAYCPYKAGLTAEERQIEGGTNDARDRPLHTLEDHLADPATHPYVSCAGDLTLWRYGQQVLLPSISDTAIFRVVDTGSHFHGPVWDTATQGPPPATTAKHPLKVIRVPGHEPIDVCVNDCANHPPGFGAQQGEVPDEGTIGKVADSIADAFRLVGVEDPDVPSIVAVGVGLSLIALGTLMGA